MTIELKTTAKMRSDIAEAVDAELARKAKSISIGAIWLRHFFNDFDRLLADNEAKTKEIEELAGRIDHYIKATLVANAEIGRLKSRPTSEDVGLIADQLDARVGVIPMPSTALYSHAAALLRRLAAQSDG